MKNMLYYKYHRGQLSNGSKVGWLHFWIINWIVHKEQQQRKVMNWKKYIPRLLQPYWNMWDTLFIAHYSDQARKLLIDQNHQMSNAPLCPSLWTGHSNGPRVWLLYVSKFPTLDVTILVKTPIITCPPPPLPLNIDRCINLQDCTININIIDCRWTLFMCYIGCI